MSWGWFVASQIAFGLTAGEVVSRSTPVRTLQSYTLPGRAGLEVTPATSQPEDHS